MLRCLFPILGLTILFCGCQGASSTQEMPADMLEDAEEQGLETPATGSVIELSTENTRIQFVGNHVGDDPKPRTCTFNDFRGSVTMADTVTAVEVQIDTTSLAAEMDDLTKHLKNADFFDVNQFPTAMFKSTEIKMGEEGNAEIMGELTLLGQTHPVSFPATIDTAEGLRLDATFKIDRTLWGMEYGQEKIEKMVEMTLSIGS